MAPSLQESLHESLQEIDASYQLSLQRDETYIASILLFFKLQVLDLVGTIGMISSFGIEAEANHLAKEFLAAELDDLVTLKLVVIPLIVFLSSGFAYARFKRNFQEKGQCKGWAERVTITLEAINTIYMIVFIVIFVVNARIPLEPVLNVLFQK